MPTSKGVAMGEHTDRIRRAMSDSSSTHKPMHTLDQDTRYAVDLRMLFGLACAGTIAAAGFFWSRIETNTANIHFLREGQIETKTQIGHMRESLEDKLASIIARMDRDEGEK